MNLEHPSIYSSDGHDYDIGMQMFFDLFLMFFNFYQFDLHYKT